MALKAGVEAYRESSLYPVEQWTWDKTAARHFRYVHAANYYNNTIYRDIVKYAAQHKNTSKLYAHVRGVYNPVGRLVDIYPEKVYGGALDMEKLKAGAIPLVGADDRLADAIRLVWRWSNWQSGKSLYVRQGALYGDSPLKITTDLESGKVRIEPMHPSKIYDAAFNAVGDVKEVWIAYDDLDPETGRAYLYEEMITGEKWEIYRDGKLVDEWDNPYGFVPMVITRHKDSGFLWGQNAFQTALFKIDELNDAAASLNDQVRKTVRAIWGVFGAAGVGEIKATAETKGQLPMIYFPGGSDAKPMVAPLDLAAALENVREMLSELERDMPELSLYRVREQGDMTAPGVRAGWSDAIGRITEARGQYDGGLVRAHMMAISMGAVHRLPGFEAFSINSYALGTLEHAIAERPVIDDSMTLQERITAIAGLKDLPQAVARLVMTELNFSEEDIADVTAEIEESQERATRNAVRGFAEGIFGAGGGDPQDTPEEGAGDGEKEITA